MLQVGIFGPLETQPPAQNEVAGDIGNVDDAATRTAEPVPVPVPPPSSATGPPSSEELDASRKRLQQQQLPNGSPVKRPRLSNGYENGHDAGINDTATPMDIDPTEPQPHPQDNHAYPSPLEGEQAQTPIVHTDGPEQGTQMEKVEELLPETTFIRLANDARPTNNNNNSNASPTPDDGPHANAPILLSCEWNPKDPSVLAAAGTDALARVWTVPRHTTSDEPNHDHVFSHGLPLLESDAPPSTTVTALAWTSDGSTLAVAVDLGSKATINICSSDGVLLQELAPSEPPVIKLCWNPSNTALLAISPDKSGALVTVYDASAGNFLSYHLPGHEILTTPLDATWTSDSDFMLSGGDMLASFYCSNSSIVEVKKFDTKEDDSFTQVLFDWRSKLIATSSDKGVLDVSNRSFPVDFVHC